MTPNIRSASSQPWGEINVTPLIDVLLVLLIIFMVIAPVAPRGLNVALPHPSLKSNPVPETPIVVQISSTRDGLLSYKVNQADVSADDLESRLGAILSVRANRVMFVVGDGKLDFSAIARVVDIGKAAGAEHIGLMKPTDPEFR